ncbi:hypothetical protein J2T09_004250 [Neorhizobium huautlense]|uniref:Transposase n=1 Tax=Neorhizobium huautlense TaxID=67774 RepID=A0ABT9PYB3_9HYPH|nr:hypothetical protein [Neorhizobium huautlense]
MVIWVDDLAWRRRERHELVLEQKHTAPRTSIG